MTSSNIIASTREVYDFHGGIHPEEMKSLSNQTPITKPAIPPKLVLPLQQHIGKPGKIIVEIGQKVLKGQMLAEADGFISAALHAPTSGLIESIGDHPIAHPSGQSDTCLTLIPDGEDRWCELEVCEDYLALAVNEIQRKVTEAGISGMGGAGFPTAVKLHPPKQAKVNTYILNAAECEPYITSDDRLLRERANDVIAGIQIVASILKPKECLIGIEDNKPEAILALREAVFGTDIEVCVLPTKYPSGGEKQLIKLLTDKEVPSGKIPADIGIVCQNVATVAAIYRAVRYGEPLISRITTLTGMNIHQRGNVEALLGTPIDWLISQYDYRPATKNQRLIMGGPMMGFTLMHSDVPVVKTTNCILAPGKKELPIAPPAQACIRCGLCADACPAELLPQQLYWFSRSQELEKAEHHNLFDCIECGACSFVCPSSIPLVQYYRHTKGEIRQHKADLLKSDQARERFEARQLRLDREKEEKDAKRKARAEAAAKAQATKKAAGESSAAPSGDSNDPVRMFEPKSSEVSQQEANTTPEIETVDLEALKLAWDKAQSKLDKMYDALEDAKANNPDNVAKLTRAVEKNQMRVNQAKLAWNKASETKAQPLKVETETTEQITKIESVDIEALELALGKAESKLMKLQSALDNAKPEQVEKLTRAVEKNKGRVESASLAVNQARTSTKTNNETEIELPDLPALELAFEKADSKLAKLQNALDNAQPDQVEKLTRAVDKNKVRVETAENAVLAARAMLAKTVTSTEAGDS